MKYQNRNQKLIEKIFKIISVLNFHGIRDYRARDLLIIFKVNKRLFCLFTSHNTDDQTDQKIFFQGKKSHQH